MPEFKPFATPFDLADYPADFSPCHRRVLSARGIAPEQLKKSLSQLHPVSQLSGAIAAAERIYRAIQQKENIVVVGDYDADGATAMAVVVSVLRHLHANVDTVVPNRVRMGYGLSEKAVEQVLAKNAQLVITVDNGISAVNSVTQLIQRGVDVIITDHHLPPAILPPATVIVNPNVSDCDFPSKSLAGVGVAFYVMLALRQVYRQANDTALDDFNLTDLLPFVAIGTIADVVPLDFNNRILIEQGLRRIRTGRCSAGILALINIAALSAAELNATEIAFQLAPRLNAAGRIADMQLGVDCLLATTPRLAQDYATELDRLNRERKTIENEMRLQADELLKQPCQTAGSVICLHDKDWNEGLIGIVAARLKDKHQKTAFVFTQAEEKTCLKASARAADGVNLIDALDCLNQQHPDLLANYGGHSKAAGLTINAHNYPRFSGAIEPIIAQQLQYQDKENAIYTDGELLPQELNIENAGFLKTLETWGNGIPEPLFENTFYIDSIKEVGKNHAQMQLIENASGLNFRGIAFNKFAYYDKLTKQRCRIAYRLSTNQWQGQHYLTLLVMHIRQIT